MTAAVVESRLLLVVAILAGLIIIDALWEWAKTWKK